MIRGVHTMFYSSAAAELRAFIRDKLGFAFSDVGDGWLIFDLPEADMGVHPAAPEGNAVAGTHDVSFYCDDVRQTMDELKERGVEFTMEVEDHGYGLVTYFQMPGGVVAQLYQPKYQKNNQKKNASRQATQKKRATGVRAVKKAKRKATKKASRQARKPR